MTLPDTSRVLLDHAPPDFERMWAARLAWRLSMHRGQAPPPGDWTGWFIQAGRGFGKTLVGSFDCAENCLDTPRLRYGIIAPTLGDVRDTCLEGETGLINVLTEGTDTYMGMGLVEGKDFDYNRSLLEVTFQNGAHVKGFGTEKPDRLRGPQHHRLWFEELAAYKDAKEGDALNTAFNNAMLGLRLGTDSRWIGTSTPRYNQLVLDITEKTNVKVTRGTTYDNLGNLSQTFIDAIMVYEGTPLERQELLGEIVEFSGSMFHRDWFRYFRQVGDTYHLADGTTLKDSDLTKYITCDPAISKKDTADYTVFAVWGKVGERRLLLEVVRDRLEAPEIIETAGNLKLKHQAIWIGFESVAFQAALVQWARRAGLAAFELKADRDKVTRALPLVSALKGGMVEFRAGAPWLDELEKEMMVFDGTGEFHDDQVDALAYGIVARPDAEWAVY